VLLPIDVFAKKKLTSYYLWWKEILTGKINNVMVVKLNDFIFAHALMQQTLQLKQHYSFFQYFQYVPSRC